MTTVERDPLMKYVRGVLRTATRPAASLSSPERHDREYGVSPMQQSRLGRYVGRLMLLGGDHYDAEFTSAAARQAALTMRERGIMRPGIMLGLHSVLSPVREDNNGRLAETQSALHDTIKDYGVVPLSIAGRVHTSEGVGTATARSYNAVDSLVRKFEAQLGYIPNDETEPDEVAVVAVVNTRWASRVFRGINYDDFSRPGELAVLRNIGDRSGEHKWLVGEPTSFAVPSHD